MLVLSVALVLSPAHLTRLCFEECSIPALPSHPGTVNSGPAARTKEDRIGYL
ncbi:hypothetical protein HYS48_04575 [Candidatus Woesearchaeota archaeon]|nr:hypothetical protein [Candidatus Woesearchaeota archaeon]